METNLDHENAIQDMQDMQDMQDNCPEKKSRVTTVGGQALIEGLMMIGPRKAAIAIRKPDGEIALETMPIPAKDLPAKIPVVRGVVNFVRQLVLGMKALVFSAQFVEIEEDQKRGEEQKPIKQQEGGDEQVSGQEQGSGQEQEPKASGEKLKDGMIYMAVVIAIVLSVSLFVLLPNLLASLLHFDKQTGIGVILYNLFEGLIRILLFFGYIAAVSNIKDIGRVWQYHGAEHKTIHCYEHMEELTIENVRKFTTKHPRCGTSFLFLVLVVSILVFSFTGWHSIFVNIGLRLLLIPLVAGLSYELLKAAGRSKGILARILNAPGLAFQYFTTREPDDAQIEVAITAFNKALAEGDAA